MVALRRAVELREDLAPAWSELGRLHLVRNEAEKAREAYAKATALAPGDHEAWRGLGDALEVSGRLEEALKARKEVVKAALQRPEAWTRLGDTLEAMSKSAAAVKVYEKSLELHPDQPAVRVKLEGLRRKLASAASPAAATPGPRVGARTLNEMGMKASGQAEHEDALRLFTQARQLEPGNPLYWLHLGMQHARAREDAQALDVFRQMLARDRTDRVWASGFLWFGEYKEKAGDYAAARHAYQQVLGRHPADAVAQEGARRATTMLEQTAPRHSKPRIKGEVQVGPFRFKIK